MIFNSEYLTYTMIAIAAIFVIGIIIIYFYLDLLKSKKRY